MNESQEMPFATLSAEEVHTKLNRGDVFRLIDVREPHEHQVASIKGAELLPLSRHQEWIHTLPHDVELVFFCHAGFRSHQIAHFLATQMNYTNVAHMAGGIDDWSVRVDPAVPRY